MEGGDGEVGGRRGAGGPGCTGSPGVRVSRKQRTGELVV